MVCFYGHLQSLDSLAEIKGFGRSLVYGVDYVSVCLLYRPNDLSFPDSIEQIWALDQWTYYNNFFI